MEFEKKEELEFEQKEELEFEDNNDGKEEREEFYFTDEEVKEYYEQFRDDSDSEESDSEMAR